MLKEDRYNDIYYVSIVFYVLQSYGDDTMAVPDILSRQLKIGEHLLKNRIVVPPMADIALSIPSGYINEALCQRYTAYAAGGAGLITVEGSNVTHMPDVRDAIALWDDAYIPGLKKLASRVKKNGAVGMIQIMNIGLKMMKYNSIEAIVKSELLAYQQDFVQGAVRCCKAGFDGIELHAAHGYFLNQMIEMNERSDEYGGSLENRLRYIVEIIEAIKIACGKSFLVSVRLGCPTIAMLVQAAGIVEKHGADMISVSTGAHNYCGVPDDFPMDSKLYAAWQVKQHVQIPVIGVGNIRYGQDAAQALTCGYADLIAVGRSHWADPAWAKHVLNGEEPNPCYRCKPCRWFKNGQDCPARKILDSRT